MSKYIKLHIGREEGKYIYKKKHKMGDAAESQIHANIKLHSKRFAASVANCKQLRN